MKLNLFIFYTIVCLYSLSSCYDDNSTFATNDIGCITFTQNQSDVFIGSLEELKLSPDIQMSDATNTDALEYQWELTEVPITSSPTYDFEFETIGTDTELTYIVDRPISNVPYTLKLTVTDTSHGNLQYIRIWKIYVHSSFLDGILISDSQDGLTSDFTLINNKFFTLNYIKEEQIFRQILTSINGSPHKGMMQSLNYEVYSYGYTAQTNQIWAIESNGTLSRFNCLDYTQNGQFTDQSLIINKPNDMQVLSAFMSYTFFYINTTSGLYTLFPSNVNRFSNPHGTFNQLRADNNVIAYSPNTGYVSNTLSNAQYQNLTFYDKTKGAFVTCDGSGQFMLLTEFEASSNFNPNELPNQTAKTAIVFEDMSQIVFLMKDDTSGTYSIYTFNRIIRDGEFDDNGIWIPGPSYQPASAKSKFVIPTEGGELLDKAVSVFFSNKNQLLYVATPDGIYTINYGSSSAATVNKEAKYTPNAGETITKVKMYQQGLYNIDCKLIVGTEPTVAQTEWNNKALIITTQSSEYEGKIYIIPITQVATGTLDPSKAKVYDGFGKILDVTTTGY